MKTEKEADTSRQRHESEDNSDCELIAFTIALNAKLKKAFVVHEQIEAMDEDETLRIARHAAETLAASLELPETLDRFDGSSEIWNEVRSDLPNWDFDPSFDRGTRAFRLVVVKETNDQEAVDPEVYTLDIAHSGEAEGAFGDVVVASTMLTFYAEKILPLVLGGGEVIC